MPFAGETGTAIVRQFLAFLTGAPNPSIDYAASELATCWCRREERAERLLNAVLILHFPGPRHGRTSERAEQFITELEVAGSARALIHARLRAGEEIPGFGHPLYPDGDPRARLILRLPAEDFRRSSQKFKTKSTIRKARLTKRPIWTWRWRLSARS